MSVVKSLEKCPRGLFAVSTTNLEHVFDHQQKHLFTDVLQTKFHNSNAKTPVP